MLRLASNCHVDKKKYLERLNEAIYPTLYLGFFGFRQELGRETDGMGGLCLREQSPIDNSAPNRDGL